MTWVAVAVGVGSAVVGAGASMYGSKKQADASKKGAAGQMAMFNTLQANQKPYMQAGYGATQKLNTLLGIGGGGSPTGAPAMAAPMPNNGYRSTPNGGIQQQVAAAPQNYGAPPNAPNLPLKHILALRAQNGDTEAQRVLQGMV